MAPRKPDAPNVSGGPSPDPVAALVRLLDLETIKPDVFQGLSPKGGWGRVYGGQVLAQAIVAASRTVEAPRRIHSLHAYFLVGGAPAEPIRYEVERLRDGGSFATRRVTAVQAAGPIFSMIGSFHGDETGFAHALPMPTVPPPEDVAPIGDVFARPEALVPDTMRAYYTQDRPIDIRLIETERYFGTPNPSLRQHMWLKVRSPLPDGPSLHAAILAYASDFALLDTALIPHGKLMFDPKMQLASLDHALWLHNEFRMDDWLLYVLESPVAAGGRGFARGTFFTREGALVASVTQEGLMRARSTSFVIK
jgi:acyl-CoA thioesterase II